MKKKAYNKKPMSATEQISQLLSRGMVIDDAERARYYLQNIGYYRLSGYWFSYQKRDNSNKHDHFNKPVSFDTILDNYIFDRKLRLLALDAIERIEVAIKATISDTMSKNNGPHWYLEEKFFSPKNYNHKNFIEQVKSEIGMAKPNGSRTRFIDHYFETYDSPELPPCWMVFECLSFGKISYLFSRLEREHRKEISEKLGLPESILKSWLHSISHIRNICAHHSRIWNRAIVVKPKIRNCDKPHVLSENQFYAHAVAIKTILRVVSSNSLWSKRIANLFNEHPKIMLKDIGFPENWTEYRPWSTNS